MKNALIALLVLLLILSSGCGENTAEYSATEILFDTVVQIKIFGGGEQVLGDALSLCRKYDTLFSHTSDNSDIGRINNSSGEPVEVADETAELLKTALEYCERSEGRFDISIYPVTRLWDFSAQNPSVPQKNSLKEACGFVDYKNIVLDRNFVTVKNGAKINLGAVAKGYIADRLAEFLQQKGVEKAIINLGGNIKLVGNVADNGKYTVGIKKPFDEHGELSAVIKVDGGSVVTSGIYERCFTVDGRLYHHILNSKSGMPIDSDFASVTIVCESSLLADTMSTFCFTVGYEQACGEIEGMPGVEAVFIMNSGNISVTSGLQVTEGDIKTVLFRRQG